MAIIEQCNKCGRDLSKCPHYNQEENFPCQFYQNPIDNSGFFSHFLSTKGRIGRAQYLVAMLIALVIYYACVFFSSFWLGAAGGMDAVNSNLIIISIIAFIPSAALMIVAGLKRCHDSGADWWYAIMPVVLLFMVNIIIIILGASACFFLFFQKGDEGVNPHGTEPLKPYQPQIQWQ